MKYNLLYIFIYICICFWKNSQSAANEWKVTYLMEYQQLGTKLVFRCAARLRPNTPVDETYRAVRRKHCYANVNLIGKTNIIE